MNNVAAIEKLNERELELGLAGTSASWHAKYGHSSIVYVGGLATGVTEGDVVAVFEQVGRLVHINLVRDGDGVSKRFCFLGYADQRSTVLAVDNFNGAELYGKVLRVDHVDKYKEPEEEAVDLRLKKRKKEKDRVVERPREVVQRDEDRRKRAVKERLEAMRRLREATEASERDGRTFDASDAAQMMQVTSRRASAGPGNDLESVRAETGDAVDGDAAAERRREKLERREQRRLAREAREQRREERAERRSGR